MTGKLGSHTFSRTGCKQNEKFFKNGDFTKKKPPNDTYSFDGVFSIEARLLLDERMNLNKNVKPTMNERRIRNKQ